MNTRFDHGSPAMREVIIAESPTTKTAKVYMFHRHFQSECYKTWNTYSREQPGMALLCYTSNIWFSVFVSFRCQILIIESLLKIWFSAFDAPSMKYEPRTGAHTCIFNAEHQMPRKLLYESIIWVRIYLPRMSNSDQRITPKNKFSIKYDTKHEV